MSSARAGVTTSSENSRARASIARTDEWTGVVVASRGAGCWVSWSLRALRRPIVRRGRNASECRAVLDVVPHGAGLNLHPLAIGALLPQPIHLLHAERERFALTRRVERP